jgi:nucleoid-associated protein YgaU
VDTSVIKIPDVVHIQEGPSQPEQINGISEMMQEIVKSAHPTAKIQPDGDITKKLQAIPNPKSTEGPFLVTVKKGDSIFKMALEIYGTSNETILELIKKHNPQVKDLNRISVGEQIVFPKFPATPE